MLTCADPGRCPINLSPIKIHHSSYIEGVLGWPRPESIFVGEKVLVRMIEAVLGPHQDIGELADADDLVITRGRDPDEALPAAPELNPAPNHIPASTSTLYTTGVPSTPAPSACAVLL